MKKIIILVIASNDPEHEIDLATQKRTWISQCSENISVIFLRGWENNYFLMDKDTLYVPCREEYSLILTKTLLGIEYLLENINFDILIRTNVSTYFESERLNQELSKPVYDCDFFGGYFDRMSSKHSHGKKSSEYISGAGIFISRSAAVQLSKLIPKAYKGIYDDVAIFDFLNDKKEIISIRMLRNNLHYTHIFIPTFYIRTKNSFNSSSASRRMILIHEYFMSSTILTKIKAYFKIQKNELNEYLNHPEGIFQYIAKNRVVFLSFLRTQNYSRAYLYRNAK